MEQTESELLSIAVYMAENAIREVHDFLFLRGTVPPEENSDYMNETVHYTIEDPTPETFVNKVFMGAGSLAAQGARLLGLQSARVIGRNAVGALYICNITLEGKVLKLHLRSRACARAL